MMNIKTPVTAIFLIWTSAFLAACASVAVTSDSLENRTAASLGIDRGTFTISDRTDEGIRTNYTVTTKNGIKYVCYVTGTVSVLGRTVSDAICKESARPATAKAAADIRETTEKPGKKVSRTQQQITGQKQVEPPSSTRDCNALLSAAGKC
jgi:hypothetical protein